MKLVDSVVLTGIVGEGEAGGGEQEGDDDADIGEHCAGLLGWAFGPVLCWGEGGFWCG